MEYSHAVNVIESIIRQYVRLLAEKHGMDETESKAIKDDITKAFNKVRNG